MLVQRVVDGLMWMLLWLWLRLMSAMSPRDIEGRIDVGECSSRFPMIAAPNGC